MNQVARPPAAQDFDTRTPKATLSYQSLQVIAAGADGCALILAGVLGFSSYQFYLNGTPSHLDDGFGVGVISSILFIILSHSRGFYQLQAVLSPAIYIKYTYLIIAITLLALINFMFLLKVGAEYSRGSVISFGILAFALIPLGRLALAYFSAIGIKTGAIAGRRAVLIGEGSELERLTPNDLRRFGMQEVARVGVIQSESGKGLNGRGRIQVTAAIALARELHAAEFVLTLPWSHERLLAEIGDLLRSSPLSVKLLPDVAVRSVLGRQRRGGMDSALAVEIQREPLSRWEQLLKRTLDLALSLSAMTLLSPFLLLTALAIKLDSGGPALFRQRRIGFDNREFVIFKFRTMRVLDDGDNIAQAHRGDARVTRIGKLLRRSSIDELPQLFNVILGDMSLVGPRPHATAHHDQYGALIATYALRHHVKPGLTGLAQMRGLRGETHEVAQMERRVEQDLWYINHWSLALDLMIMARTCLVLLRQDVY